MLFSTGSPPHCQQSLKSFPKYKYHTPISNCLLLPISSFSRTQQHYPHFCIYIFFISLSPKKLFCFPISSLFLALLQSNPFFVSLFVLSLIYITTSHYCSSFSCPPIPFIASLSVKLDLLNPHTESLSKLLHIKYIKSNKNKNEEIIKGRVLPFFIIGCYDSYGMGF